MTALPNPFLSAASFPAAVEPAAAHAHAPREAAAAINSNSACNVMLQSGSVTAVEAAPNAAVAAPISRITHNPVTQAVEVRPCSDAKDVPAQMQGSNDCGLARDDVKPGDTMQESRPAHPATATSDATNHIGEIFHFARKLLEEEEDLRRAEDFVDRDELEAALDEELPIFIRDGDHLRRWA